MAHKNTDGAIAKMRPLACLFIACITFLTTACVQLDRFSGRATEFNAEVADSQNRTMLLNVMRAAHRFPMHFTELSTLSGTELFSATAGMSLPFSSFHGGNGVRTGSPSATVSQSPTFNVAVLETQEFYRGMLAPLTHEQMLTYVNEGIAPELVFSLMFGSLIYRETADAADAGEAAPIVLENNFHALKAQKEAPPVVQDPFPALCPSAKSGYACFQSVLRALINRRLTIEATSELENLGPPLGEASFRNSKAVRELEAQGLKLAAIKPKDCDDKSPVCPEGLDGLSAAMKKTLKDNGVLFRIQKKSSGYRFCFDEQPGVKSLLPESDPVPTGLALRIMSADIDSKLICHNRVGRPMPASVKEKENDKRGAFSFKTFTIQVQPRSTEGLIYYLGEIARCDLELDKSSGSNCSVKPTVRVPYRENGVEDTLFKVHKGRQIPADSTEAHEILVDWYGKGYGVVIDPSARDRTGQVLRVMTQLLALNRSAKDFPAPTVVPLITR
jgi:hypothetical protein